MTDQRVDLFEETSIERLQSFRTDECLPLQDPKPETLQDPLLTRRALCLTHRESLKQYPMLKPADEINDCTGVAPLSKHLQRGC